jgi:LytTr DNA-binding domain
METEKILVGSRKKFTPEEIIYLKSDQNYTNVFLSNGNKVLVSTTLKIIEDRFVGCGFLRVHRSTVVNMSFVKTYIDNELSGELILSNNNKIPVSRRKNEKLRHLNLNIMKKISILCIFLMSNFFGYSQQSVTLDSKSVTVPRYADLSAITTAVTSPQTGMMVYNIGTQTNWTYNGTTWVNAAGSGSSQWTTSGSTINYSTGNVGIGVLNPAFPLASKGRIQIFDQGGGESAGLWLNNNGNTLLNTFVGIDPSNQFGIYSPVLSKNIFLANMANGGIRLEGPSVSSPAVSTLSLGGYGKVSIDAAGLIGGRMTILENGKIGIGNNNPNALLQFANTVANRKIVLFENANNEHQYYGIGINSAMQRYQVGDVTNDHVFFAGASSTTSNELMRIKGNGNIGIGTNNPVQKLDVEGSIKISNGSLRLSDPTTQALSIYSSLGYLTLRGGDAVGGNGVWINNTGSVIGGIKFQATGAIEIASSEGTTGQVLTSGGAGNTAQWKDIPKTQHIELSEVSYIVPNNNLNMVPGATVTFNAPTAGKLIIWSNFKNRFACANPLDHCYLVYTLHTFLDGNQVKGTEIQSTIAYGATINALYNNHAIAPVALNVSAGSHTISFGETLSSITPGPTVYVSTYAQFIPN